MSDPSSSPLAGLFGWLGGHRIEAREIRAEVWALGGRHRGCVEEGARLELDEPGLPGRRAALLRAVIRSLGTSRAG